MLNAIIEAVINC